MAENENLKRGGHNMTKEKTTYDYMKKIRNEWMINSRTRVRENELRNKKKRRQNEKKIIREGMYR